MKNTSNKNRITNSNSNYFIIKQEGQNTVIQCGICMQLLRVPNHSSGKMKCPKCKNNFEWLSRPHSATSSSTPQPRNFLQSFVNKFSKGPAEQLKVAFTGPFSSGKSSLINWLLRVRCLPVFLTPTPCPPIRLAYSDKISFTNNRRNNTFKNFEELRSHLKTLDLNNKTGVCMVTAPIPLLQTGLELFDVTGSNSPYESHYQVVNAFYRDVLHQMDFVFYVRRIGPLDATDLELIRSIHNKSLSYAIILTQADTLDSGEDLHAIIQNNRKSLESKQLNPHLLVTTLNPNHNSYNLFENIFAIEVFFSQLTSIMQTKHHIAEVNRYILQKLNQRSTKWLSIDYSNTSNSPSKIIKDTVYLSQNLWNQLFKEYSRIKLDNLHRLTQQRFTIDLPEKNAFLQENRRNNMKSDIFSEISHQHERMAATQKLTRETQWDDFKNVQKRLLTILARLSGLLSQSTDLRSFSKICNDLRHDLNKEAFSIAVIGEMKRGKSTLLNTLLRFDEEVLSTNVNPETARLSKIRYAQKPEAIVYLQNDRQGKKIPFKQLKKYTSSESGDPDLLERTLYAEIGIPEDILRDGVVFVDTPGVNDPDEEREKITIDHLKEANAAIFLIYHFGGLTDSELNFLRERILSQNGISGIIFVFNRIDELESHSPEEIKSMFNNTRTLLYETISKMLLDTREEDIVLLPLSAKKAFEAHKGNPSKPIYTEMFKRFEKELYGTLIRCRGKHLINRIVQKAINNVITHALAQVNTKLEINQQKDQKGRQKKINELEEFLRNFDSKTNRLISDVQKSMNQYTNQFADRYESIIPNELKSLNITSSDVEYVSERISLNTKMQSKLKDKSVLLMTQLANHANSIVKKAIDQLRCDYNTICRDNDFSPRKTKDKTIDIPNPDLHIRAGDISSEWKSGFVGFIKGLLSDISHRFLGGETREDRKIRELKNKLQLSWEKELNRQRIKEKIQQSIINIISSELREINGHSQFLSKQFKTNLEDLSRQGQATDKAIQQCKQLMAEIYNFENQLMNVYRKVNRL